jgi:hypothetical protein
MERISCLYNEILILFLIKPLPFLERGDILIFRGGNGMEIAEAVQALDALAKEINALVYGIREVPDPIFEIICDGSKDEALIRFVDRFHARLGALKAEIIPKP